MFFWKKQKTALVKVDMSGDSRASECIDALVCLPHIVEQMREKEDLENLPHIFLEATRIAFDRIESSDLEALRLVASSVQDALYRHASEITIFDCYTQAYCQIVLRHMFERFAALGMRTFYILDNALRDDRLEAVLEIFQLSGVPTTTPRHDGMLWQDLAPRLQASLDHVGHAIYIEPDAVVNHLDAVQLLAARNDCIATFRNEAPQDPRLTILSLGGP
jgi:hypothetical protein